MIILAPGDTLRARLAAAPASANPSFSFASADDGAARTLVPSKGVLNGTTNVDLVSAPADGTNRVVRSGFLYNADSAAVTVTVDHYDGTTARVLTTLTLPSGYTLSLGDDGFRVIDANGAAVAPGASTGPIAAKIQFTATAKTNLAAESVAAIDGSGVYNPDLTNPADVANIVGVCATAATAGNSVTVQTIGTFTENLWGWSPGPIYCDVSGGALTQSAPATGAVIQVATVLTPKTIQVGIGPAYLRS